jgi:hypothetical protein
MDAALVMLAVTLFQDDQSCQANVFGRTDLFSQAVCGLAATPVDSEIGIEFRSRDFGILMDATQATVRADRASGLFQVDVSSLLMDSRETRKRWKPRATIVGPLRPEYNPLTETVPGPMDDSYISASAYSDWRRIVAAAGKRDATWIALKGDQFTKPSVPISADYPPLWKGIFPVGLGFGFMGLFGTTWPSPEVPADSVLDPTAGVEYAWGDRSDGGSVKYGPDRLPRSAERHT